MLCQRRTEGVIGKKRLWSEENKFRVSMVIEKNYEVAWEVPKGIYLTIWEFELGADGWKSVRLYHYNTESIRVIAILVSDSWVDLIDAKLKYLSWSQLRGFSFCTNGGLLDRFHLWVCLIIVLTRLKKRVDHNWAASTDTWRLVWP